MNQAGLVREFMKYPREFFIVLTCVSKYHYEVKKRLNGEFDSALAMHLSYV